MATARQDKRMLHLKESQLVIVLDDLDLTWLADEIDEAAKLYEMGAGIAEMASVLRPYDTRKNSVDEVALLIMHMSRRGIIRPRPSGVRREESEFKNTAGEAAPAGRMYCEDACD